MSVEASVAPTVPGVLMPQLKHRFRIKWVLLNTDITDTLSQQIIDFKISFSESTVSMTIEQPFAGGALYELLYHVFGKEADSKRHIYLIPMTGGGEESDYQIRFDVLPIHHEFVLDYAEDGVASHELLFEIKNVVSVTPNEINEDV